jgi:chromosome segregation ATPase
MKRSALASLPADNPAVATVSSAKAKLQKIAEDRERLSAKRAALSSRLAMLDQEKGQAYLDGNLAPVKEAAEINAEISAIESALLTLTSHEQAGKRDLQSAEAHEKRAQASVLKQELEALNRKTLPLLEQLSKLELEGGHIYTRSILASQPSPGTWREKWKSTPPQGHENMLELDADVTARTPLTLQPRSRKLLEQIQQFEKEAAELESKVKAAEEQQRSTEIRVARDLATEFRELEERLKQLGEPSADNFAEYYETNDRLQRVRQQISLGGQA